MNKLQEYNTIHMNVFKSFEWMEEGGPSNTYEERLIQENDQKKFWYVHVQMENKKSLRSKKAGEHST